MSIKLKWKVDPAPTGRYRSFENRAWPSAMFKDTDRPAASISCDIEYIPRLVKTGEHPELTVRIASYKDKEVGFTWRILNKRAFNIDEAKRLAEDFFNNNPEHLPGELR